MRKVLELNGKTEILSFFGMSRIQINNATTLELFYFLHIFVL